MVRCLGRSRHGLPDPHALVGRQIEFVAGLHVEGGVPGIEIGHLAVDPERSPGCARRS